MREQLGRFASRATISNDKNTETKSQKHNVSDSEDVYVGDTLKNYVNNSYLKTNDETRV